VPGAFWPLLIALGVAGAVTLGLVVVLGIFPARPRYLVPVGGMVIGNAMTAAAVALNRLGQDVTDSRAQIEATLALGPTSAEAIPHRRADRARRRRAHAGALVAEPRPDPRAAQGGHMLGR